MDISIIIPTRNRPDKLSHCLRALSRQQIPTMRGLSGSFEVLVSLDGTDDASTVAANAAWEG
ncbi:MAG: glycosyltransferase, partial [Pyrinomonadaceae bacterium]|nr:glycosyltransferase [Phycisphaerales bacterium]